MRSSGVHRTVSAAEQRFVWSVAAVAAAVTSLPSIASWYVARAEGLFWTGVGLFGRGDASVYLSYIIQGARGRVFMEDLFTTEQVQTRLDPFWSLAGQAARSPLIGPLGAFHLSRILLIPALAWASYLCISHLLRDRTERAASFLTFMFASGIGAYLIPLLGGDRTVNGYVRYPTDLWVPESVPFLSMSYSPHFVASFLLLIVAFCLLLRSFRTGSVRTGAVAGAAALFLFAFHPFHAPTLYAVPFAYLAIRWATGVRPSRRNIAAFMAFVVLSVPAVLYHYLRLSGTPSGEKLLAANLTLTPPLPYVLAGLGVMLPLAVWGVFLARNRMDAPNRTFLAVWAVVQAALCYAPLTFQRRLMEGLMFPLAVFAGLAVAELWKRRSRYAGARRQAYVWTLAVVVVMTLLPSNVTALVRGSSLLAHADTPFLFYGADEDAAFAWMREHVADDEVVLASFRAGNVIPGQTGKRVYAGHPVETIDAAVKSVMIDAFYHDMTQEEQRAFLHAEGISYVVVGPSERDRYGSVGFPWLTAAFSAGEVTVYGTGE